MNFATVNFPYRMVGLVSFTTKFNRLLLGVRDLFFIQTKKFENLKKDYNFVSSI